MRHAMRLPILIFGCWLWSTAGAQVNALVVNHWICDVDTEPPIVRTVPVGCEIVDTTLGCPTAKPLALQFHFEAPPGAEATLTVSNPPLGLAPAPNATNVTKTGPATYKMLPGRTTLVGFLSDASPAPILATSVTLPQTAISGTSFWLTGPESAGLVKLKISQIVNNYVVSSATVRHYYYPCTSSTGGDHITITGSSSGAVALMDARTQTACDGPDGYRGFPKIALPNLFSRTNLFASTTCLERVALYSEGALDFRKDSSVWKDAGDDDLRITLTGRAKQPVKIWVLYDPCATPGSTCLSTLSESKARPRRHLENAQRIYRQQWSGITFDHIGGNEDLAISTDRNLRNLVDNNLLRCFDSKSTKETLKVLPGLTGQDTGTYSRHLNIFYVKNPKALGQWCGAYDPVGIGRDTILLHANAYPETFAHELGHALLYSGKHANVGTDGFLDAHRYNLMTSDINGEELTLGQMFRASLADVSPLNRHGGRPGQQKVTCSGNSQSPESCPELIQDVVPR
jgi:hypothetical protein